MSPTKPPTAFVTEAYAIEDRAGVADFYQRWAEDYDEQMLGAGYCSPHEVARLLHEHLADPHAEVLDAGAGTGLTCVYLAERGYTRLDGVDLSADMVRVAGARGIYRQLLTGDLTGDLPFADASYDGIVSSGTFTHGHVGPEALPELMRVLRRGGVLACTVHEDLWSSAGFEAAFDSALERGELIELTRTPGPYYTGRAPEGWFCAYRRGR